LTEELPKNQLGKIIKVTDHSVIRYFIHILGLNEAELRKLILTEELAQIITKSGDGDYPIIYKTGLQSKQCTVVVRDGNVVTIKE